MRRILPLIVLTAAAWSVCGPARANSGDLNRCIGADGRSVCTDQPCAAMDASSRPQAPNITDSNKAAPAVRVHVRDCAATIPALRDGIQAALAAGDVNKFAAFFQWAGTGSREADAILDHLQAIVVRPLIAVTVLRAHGDAGDGARVAVACVCRPGAILAHQAAAQHDDRSVLLTNVFVTQSPPRHYARRERFDNDVRPRDEVPRNIAGSRVRHVER